MSRGLAWMTTVLVAGTLVFVLLLAPEPSGAAPSPIRLEGEISATSSPPQTGLVIVPPPTVDFATSSTTSVTAPGTSVDSIDTPDTPDDSVDSPDDDD
jgi:hypothetical protein